MLKPRLHPPADQSWRQWLFKLRGSPEAVAGGVAIGTFIAFTPTLGIQILLATLLATLCGVNRPAAVVPTLLTNPITAPPVYAFEYWLGRHVWGGPPVSQVRDTLETTMHSIAQREFLDLPGRVRQLTEMGTDVFVATLLGGCLVGTVLAGAGYVLALRAIRAHRIRHPHRRRHGFRRAPRP